MADGEASSTAIHIEDEGFHSTKGNVPVVDTAAAPHQPPPPPPPSFAARAVAPLAAMKNMNYYASGGAKRGLSILDFILRLGAIAAAIAAAVTMANTDDTLPFFTQFFQFEAQYDDFPAFKFFVVGNAVVGGYVVLSLPLSIVGIVRPHLIGPRLLLLVLDTIMMALATAAASASAAIVYLAHNGNPNANWPAICQQFNNFCQQTSAAVVASFAAAAILIVLILLGAIALRKH